MTESVIVFMPEISLCVQHGINPHFDELTNTLYVTPDLERVAREAIQSPDLIQSITEIKQLGWFQE
jgi:hypothetical protein